MAERQALLDDLPVIKEGPVGNILVALEAKACMTEHIKALPRLYDELNSSHQIVHGHSSQALSIGFFTVNASDGFYSPTNTANPGPNKHNQPHALQRAVAQVTDLPRRSHHNSQGFDGLGIVVVDMNNDGTSLCKLVTDPRVLGKHVKAISGKQRLFASTYAGILGPMIDQPWRLAVAGGIALISDKMVTRNVGSAVGWGSGPFRADVDDVIDGLARSHNRAGLLLRAHAANRFSAGRVAVNSLTGKQLRQEDQPEAEPYTHVAVDPTQEDGVARDKAEVPLHLDDYTGVELSNPKRAAKEKEERQPKDEEPKSIVEQMVDGRRELLGTLTDAQTALTRLMQLSHSPDVAGAHPLGSHREWEKVSKLAVKVQATIYSNDPDTDAVADEQDVD
ncbi:hypothetical protein ACF063_27125 [Streptomyces chartreusis]|uniref:hypothetical protein n=1 Tax=Streptomyces chartreusis TaxID=1969 RepID=UPI0036FE5693